MGTFFGFNKITAYPRGDFGDAERCSTKLRLYARIKLEDALQVVNNVFF